MSEQRMTYPALAEHWKVSPQAARTRARHGNYQCRVGNDGQAEVLVDTAAPVRKARPPRSAGQSRTVAPMPAPETEASSASTAATLAALQAHIDDLKARIAKADADTTQLRQERDDIRKERDAERERAADLTTQLGKLTADLLDARKAETARPRGWWARLVG